LTARVVMLVDLDYFFAQCEERRNPSFKNKPVVVCVYSGRTEESGAVSTANYVARGYGVRSGMPIFLAKRKLAKVEAVFLPVDRAYYEEVSERMMGILRGHADSFEQVGIDEAYLDVTARVQGSFEAAANLAKEIKSHVKSQERLTFSVGIAPNKLVSKIAADFRKPDGITVVKPEEVEGFLAPLPVDSLLGVGKKNSERMESLGIKTIGNLARFDVQELNKVFGRSLGTFFHNASLGVDDSPVQERGKTESISRFSTLKQDTRDLEVIMDKTVLLCEDIHERVIERDLSFKSIGVIAVLKDMTIHNRSRTLESSTRDSAILEKIVRELLGRLIAETRPDLRRVGVKVSGFVKEKDAQKHLTDFVESGY